MLAGTGLFAAYPGLPDQRGKVIPSICLHVPIKESHVIIAVVSWWGRKKLTTSGQVSSRNGIEHQHGLLRRSHFLHV